MSTYKASLLDALKRLSSQLSTKFAKKSDLPTKVSQLSNDSGYLNGNSTISETKISYAPVSTNSNFASKLSRPLIAECRANKFAFLPPDQVIIEKTIDGGETWTDAGISDDGKRALFSGVVSGAIDLPQIDGKVNKLCGIRITFTSQKYNVPEGTAETDKYQYWNRNYFKSQERYCNIDSMWFWLSGNYEKISCTFERASMHYSTKWTKVLETDGLDGWSGQNFIRFTESTFGGGATQIGQPCNYRLTFMTTYTNNASEPNATYATQKQVVYRIRGYGMNAWAKPNPMAHMGLPCTLDAYQNATFPATVNAKVLKESGVALSEVYATQALVKGKVDTTRDGLNTLISKAETGSSIPSANDWYLSKYAQDGIERVVKRPVSALATYIKSTIPTATTSANGYMSKEDKAKLDGLDLSTKVDKENGKGLSTNDYTTEEKDKLAGIADGATKVIVDSTFSDKSDNPASSKAISTVLVAQANGLKEYFSDELSPVEEKLDNIANSLTIDNKYPVGSIIMAISSIDPASIYGGTWVAGTLPVLGGISFDDGTMVSDIYVYKRTG